TVRCGVDDRVLDILCRAYGARIYWSAFPTLPGGAKLCRAYSAQKAKTKTKTREILRFAQDDDICLGVEEAQGCGERATAKATAAALKAAALRLNLNTGKDKRGPFRHGGPSAL